MIDYLFSIRDEKYKAFHKGLITNCNDDYIIGVKLPVLETIAKDISKGNYTLYIDRYYAKVNNPDEIVYYEEDIITAKLLGFIKYDYKAFTQAVDRFLVRVNNWSVCDTLCAGLKRIRLFKKDFFSHIDLYLKSDNPWIVRVGLVLMLDHYLDDEYVDEVLKRVSEVSDTFYYIEMAQAWLIATAYAKCRTKTHNYLTDNPSISDSVIKKSLQKIRDSRRISAEDKAFLTKHFSL